MTRPTGYRRVVRRWLWLCVAAWSLLGCTAAESPQRSGQERAEAYRRQAQRAAGELAPWQGWFQNLARGEGMDRCPAGWMAGQPTAVGAPSTASRGVGEPSASAAASHELCLRHHSQSLLWNPAVTNALASDDVDATGCCGVLRTIVHFQRQLQAVDVDLLVMLVPSASAVYPERLGFDTPLADGEMPPLLDGGLRKFYAALEDAGVEVVDVLPEYLRRRDDGAPIEDPSLAALGLEGAQRELLFFRQDPHWTSFGAAVAAEVLAQRVRDYDWFPEVAARMGQGQLEETFPTGRQLGSILRRLRNHGRAAPGIKAETLRRRQVRIRGEVWSVSDDASPIVLLGDSFSADKYDLPGQLLKQFGFRVDTVTVTGGLPNGGLKALRFRGDALHGKRLVIWEITSYALARQESWQPVDVLSEGPASAELP